MESSTFESRAFVVAMLACVLLISGILVVQGIRMVLARERRRGLAMLFAVIAWLGGLAILAISHRGMLLGKPTFCLAWFLSAGLLWFVSFGPAEKLRGLSGLSTVTTCVATAVLFSDIDLFGLDEDLARLLGLFLGTTVSAVLTWKAVRGRRQRPSPLGAAQQAVAADDPAAGKLE